MSVSVRLGGECGGDTPSRPEAQTCMHYLAHMHMPMQHARRVGNRTKPLWLVLCPHPPTPTHTCEAIKVHINVNISIVCLSECDGSTDAFAIEPHLCLVSP